MNHRSLFQPGYASEIHSGSHSGWRLRARGLGLGAGFTLALGAAGCSNTGTAAADLGPPDLAAAVTTAYDSQFIGYWGIKAKVASIQSLPGLGDAANTNTILSVAEFRHDAQNKLVMDQQECHITVASAKTFVMTTVPDKIADTTPLLTGEVQVFGMPGALGFKRAEVAVGIGCHLTNPFTDPLPTSPTDPKVFDQDTDTFPGVTVNPTSPLPGSVYVAQRRKYSYVNGVQASQTRLTGSIVDRSEQYILDASNGALKSQVPITPVDNMSVFEMVKLASKYPCTQLKTEAATLFTLQ